MPIFALDCASKTSSVCLMQNNDIIYEETQNNKLSHSETLLALVEKAFSKTKLAPKDIGCYAVTNGPGSFTGLRIGLALIKGLALPFGTSVMPVSTLHALALASGCKEKVLVSLDARRNEVYWALFDCTKTCTRLTEDAANPVTEISNYVDFSQDSFVFVGDGANLCYNEYDCASTCVHPKNSLLPIAKGAALAAFSRLEAHSLQQSLGVGNNCGFSAQKDGAQGCLKGPRNNLGGISAQNANPNYLRLSQAERERAQKLAKLKLGL